MVAYQASRNMSRSTSSAHRAFVAGCGFDIAKRLIDVLISSVLLILAAPLLVGCGLWIKAIDGGPMLYNQWRVGKDGWLFRIRKLRTMRLDAERSGAAYASKDDPRVLPGAAWMRKAHVDELPQLVNILIGQMSLVGPRPERPEMMEQIRPHLPGIERRLMVTPGLTGLAQLEGGYANDLAGMRRKLMFDLRYVRTRSITRDLRLIVKTAGHFWDPAAC